MILKQPVVREYSASSRQIGNISRSHPQRSDPPRFVYAVRRLAETRRRTSKASETGDSGRATVKSLTVVRSSVPPGFCDRRSWGRDESCDVVATRAAESLRDSRASNAGTAERLIWRKTSPRKTSRPELFPAVAISPVPIFLAKNSASFFFFFLIEHSRPQQSQKTKTTSSCTDSVLDISVHQWNRSYVLNKSLDWIVCTCL